MKDLYQVFHADIVLSNLPGARYIRTKNRKGLYIPFEGGNIMRLEDNKCYLPLRVEGFFNFKTPVVAYVDPPRERPIFGAELAKSRTKVGYFYRIFPEDANNRPSEAKHAVIHTSEDDIISII